MTINDFIIKELKGIDNIQNVSEDMIQKAIDTHNQAFPIDSDVPRYILYDFKLEDNAIKVYTKIGYDIFLFTLTYNNGWCIDRECYLDALSTEQVFLISYIGNKRFLKEDIKRTLPIIEGQNNHICFTMFGNNHFRILDDNQLEKLETLKKQTVPHSDTLSIYICTVTHKDIDYICQKCIEVIREVYF